MKEVLKKIYRAVHNNFWYKVLSAVIAVMIWIVIINIEDPVITRSFSGLEVTVQNESAILSINQVFEIVSGNTVDFSVSGKASVVKNLNISDFSATADLAKLSPVYAAAIDVKCSKQENVQIDTKNQMLVVKLEDVATKNVQVTVVPSGDPKSGYYVDRYVISPNMITVSGAESKVKNIASLKVTANIEGADRNFRIDAEPVVYDDEGNELESSKFTYYNGDNRVESVNVQVKVFNTKVIPVKLEIKGTPAEGYAFNNDYEYTPETIMIGANSKRLARIESLVIPVDITGATEEYEVNLPIDEYLPDNVSHVNQSDESNDISIRIKLDKLVTKTIAFNANDIKLINIPDNTSVVFEKPHETMSVIIKGTEDEIRDLNKDNIGLYIDLSGVSAGKATSQVMFENIPKELIFSEPNMVRYKVMNNAAADVPQA